MKKAAHRCLQKRIDSRNTGQNPDGSVAYEGGWQNNRQMGMHPEFRMVENIFEELDVPGEWFHNAKKFTPLGSIDTASLPAAKFTAAVIASPRTAIRTGAFSDVSEMSSLKNSLKLPRSDNDLPQTQATAGSGAE